MNSINQKLDILENETSWWNGFNWLIFNITRPVFMSFGVFIVVEDRAEKRKHFFIFQVINSYYLGITRNMWKILQMTKLQRQCWQFWPFWSRTKTTVQGGIYYGGGRYNFFRQQPFDLSMLWPLYGYGSFFKKPDILKKKFSKNNFIPAIINT